MKTKLSLIAATLCSLTYAQEVKLSDIDINDKLISEQTPLSSSKKTINVKDDVQSTSINDSLKKAFFVDFKKSSEYESEPYIRGRGNKGVPVFLEGMRVNEGHSDSTNIFGLSDIAQIDVYRGASGAKLGMGAMSGAVVVKFKEPIFSDKEELSLSGFANAKSSFLSKEGSSNSMGVNLYNNKVNISLSGGISDYDNYEDGDSNEVLHSKYETKSLNGSVSIKTGEDSYIYARYMRDRADSEDPYTRFLNAANNLWTYYDRPNDDSKTYFVGFRKKRVAGFDNFDIQYFKNESHYDYNVKREATVSEQQELFRESDTKGLKISANKNLGKHNLELSTKYQKMEVVNGLRRYDYGTSTWGDWTAAPGITGGEIKTFMLNASDDIFIDKAFFNLAAGYEHIKREVTSNVKTGAYSSLLPSELLSQVVQDDTDEKDNVLSLSATAGYEISPAFIPYIKVSSAARTPYFNEQYGNNPNNGSLIPNQDLDNEKVYGIDLGADGQLGKFYYSSAFYYQKYKDYIELVNTGYKTTGNLPIKQYVNLDDAEVYGVEAMIGYNITNDIFAQATYTYTRGKNKDDNTSLAYIAPQKLILSIAQVKPKGLNWRLEQELVDNQDKISEVNGEKETAGYGVTNASIAYNFDKFSMFKSATLSFELNNIFDKTYKEHLSKVSSTSYYIPYESGINGAIALNLKF
ncbi:TonB-dependent receptor [Halarcobacter anaerophilus]|uniref:TonB-dependent receptor n=1 Tax=Halarcobacter anaerophilus TaxID=877500 RepID=A0A4Q0XZC9_9BACT|nr:TonB-dependent receptor [Halarcobacter anaerophilus]QDF29740.1 TonB-dependent receptor [Halarcobacter anaerophilus]RXJ62663.1 TonB-dependent receptor [Halarcobacter anaerophilus]